MTRTLLTALLSASLTLNAVIFAPQCFERTPDRPIMTAENKIPTDTQKAFQALVGRMAK